MKGRRSWIAVAAVGVLTAPLPAETLVVANKSDHTVDLIDLATGDSRANLPTGEGPHEVAVSPDGRLAVITNYGPRGAPGASLTVIDVAGAAVVRTIELGEHTRPHGVAWLSPTAAAVTAEGSAHLLIVDVEAGSITAAVETAQRVSHMVAVTPDGRHAFVANIGSGSVSVIDLARRRKVRDVVTGAGAEGIAVTPDGAEVWVTNREADTLSVIDAESHEILATLPCPGFPIRIEITPDGSRALVSTARSGEVVLFDRAARRELLRRKLDLGPVADAASRLFGDRFGDSPVPVGLVIAPDGATAWVAATQADAIVVIGVSDLAVRDLLRAGREPDGMDHSPAGPPPARLPG